MNLNSDIFIDILIKYLNNNKKDDSFYYSRPVKLYSYTFVASVHINKVYEKTSRYHYMLISEEKIRYLKNILKIKKIITNINDNK